MLIATLVACSGGGDSSPTAPPLPPPPSSDHDSLAIVSVEPASGTTLAEGVFLRVRARLAYRFGSAAKGSLTVVVLCFEDGNVTCLDAGALADLPAANGEIAVDVGLRPRGKEARVTFSLAPDGASESTAQATVSYRID